jgi:hypothetical protein
MPVLQLRSDSQSPRRGYPGGIQNYRAVPRRSVQDLDVLDTTKLTSSHKVPPRSESHSDQHKVEEQKWGSSIRLSRASDNSAFSPQERFYAVRQGPESKSKKD